MPGWSQFYNLIKHLLIQNISVNISNGIVNLTADPDFSGIRSINFTAYDGTEISSSNEVTLTVEIINAPQTFNLSPLII